MQLNSQTHDVITYRTCLAHALYTKISSVKRHSCATCGSLSHLVQLTNASLLCMSSRLRHAAGLLLLYNVHARMALCTVQLTSEDHFPLLAIEIVDVIGL